MRQDVNAQLIKLGPTKHLAFNELQSIHMTLDDTVAPVKLEVRLHGFQIMTERDGKVG